MKRILFFLVIAGLMTAGPAEKIRDLRFSERDGDKIKSIFPEVLKEFQTARNEGKDISEALSRPSLPNYYDTEHFRIHYSLSGTDRCTEEFAERVGEVAEFCWTVEVETMGFYAPPPDFGEGGNNKYDIYIRNLHYYYGSTMPERDGPESWDDFSSYIEIENDFDGFPPTYDPEGSPWGQLKVTMAHEFFHAIQMAYNGTAPDIWILEIGAVWMEEQVYSEPDDYLSYIDDFYGYPHIGLTIETMHCYSSAPYFHFIANRYGFGAIKEVFEYARFTDNYIYSLNQMFDERGTDVAESFGDFLAWNWFTGDRTESEFYGTEGGLWPEVYVERRVTSYPFTGTVSNKPNYLASNYIELANINPTAENIKITLDGSSATDWVSRAIVYRDGGDYEIAGNGMDIGGDLVTYINDAESVEKVIFIPGTARGGINQDWVTYNYSIDIEYTDESGIKDTPLPDEKSISAFPNPFNSRCRIELGNAAGGLVEIFTKDGRRVMEIESSLDHVDIDASGLPSGIYLYKVTADNLRSSGKVTLIK